MTRSGPPRGPSLVLEEGGEPAAAEPPAGDRAKPAGAALDVGWALQVPAHERLRDSRGRRVGGGGGAEAPEAGGELARGWAQAWMKETPTCRGRTIRARCCR